VFKNKGFIFALAFGMKQFVFKNKGFIFALAFGMKQLLRRKVLTPKLEILRYKKGVKTSLQKRILTLRIREVY